MVNQVREAGYKMHAICLWAPLVVTRARGEPRSMRDGKLWKPDDYNTSTKGCADMAVQFAEGMESDPSTYISLSLWDNTVFPSREVRCLPAGRPFLCVVTVLVCTTSPFCCADRHATQVSLDQFVELSNLSHEGATRHWKHCEESKRQLHQSTMANVAMVISRLRQRARSSRRLNRDGGPNPPRPQREDSGIPAKIGAGLAQDLGPLAWAKGGLRASSTSRSAVSDSDATSNSKGGLGRADFTSTSSSSWRWSLACFSIGLIIGGGLGVLLTYLHLS
jgi:hypothetical protein